MNWPEVHEEWDQLRFVLRSYWTQLNDDDLARIGARRDGLVQVLHERYHISFDEAERQVADFERDIRFPGAVK